VCETSQGAARLPALAEGLSAEDAKGRRAILAHRTPPFTAASPLGGRCIFPPPKRVEQAPVRPRWECAHLDLQGSGWWASWTTGEAPRVSRSWVATSGRSRGPVSPR